MNSMPTTVAHCIASNFFGGPERQVLTHLGLLAEADFKAVLIPFFEKGKRNEVLHRAMEAGITVRPLTAQGAVNPIAIVELSRIIADEGIGLLVAHGYKSNVVGRIATWRRRIPEIAVSRGWTGESLKIRGYERLDRRFLRLADRVVAVSEAQRDKLVKASVPRERIEVIHNCIDVSTFSAPSGVLRRDLGIDPGVPLVISAGRLSPEKGHADMIRAARRVHEVRPDVYFAVFGEGVLRESLTGLIAAEGLERNFFLPGFRDDMRAVIHECDIFVLPSLTEGLPNVALEAAACRKPVVATRVGGTPEVVVHEETGLLVDAGNDAALADAILRLIGDADLGRRLGEHARSRAECHFSFDQQTRAYAELYRSVLRRKSV